jgi:cysteinyl-tRNA synthetase
MSKSLGNIYTLQDILDKGYDLDAFRVFSLGKHYRTEGNFTWDNLEAAANRLTRWKQTFDMRWQPHGTPSTSSSNPKNILDSIAIALQDDLDTVAALHVIDTAAQIVEQEGMTSDNLNVVTKLMQQVQDMLGIALFRDDISETQKMLIAEREKVRINKDWSKSDELRDQLISQGIGLRDTPKGSVWYWL